MMIISKAKDEQEGKKQKLHMQVDDAIALHILVCRRIGVLFGKLHMQVDDAIALHMLLCRRIRVLFGDPLHGGSVL
jgi:hypothetical protein